MTMNRAETFTCPLDGSPLLQLGASLAVKEDYDASYLFCVRCDATVLQFRQPRDVKDCNKILWRRYGASFVINKKPSSTARLSPPHLQADNEQRLFAEIVQYLRRFSRDLPVKYPFDKMSVEHVAETAIESGEKVVAKYCSGCKSVFVYVLDKKHGWELVTTYMGHAAGQVHSATTNDELIDKVSALGLDKYLTRSGQ